MAEYRIRSPRVVHETVDGEVVAIDFTTGSYYSLRGPAEAVWRALTDGQARSGTAVSVAVEDSHPDDGDPRQVGPFLDRLVDEGLLERDGPPAHPSGDAGGGGLTFDKFSDMEDLILLDPVHDVSEAGWPNAPA